jgi:hypothetical protein
MLWGWRRVGRRRVGAVPSGPKRLHFGRQGTVSSNSTSTSIQLKFTHTNTMMRTFVLVFSIIFEMSDFDEYQFFRTFPVF